MPLFRIRKLKQIFQLRDTGEGESATKIILQQPHRPKIIQPLVEQTFEKPNRKSYDAIDDYYANEIKRIQQHQQRSYKPSNLNKGDVESERLYASKEATMMDSLPKYNIELGRVSQRQQTGEEVIQIHRPQRSLVEIQNKQFQEIRQLSPIKKPEKEPDDKPAPFSLFSDPEASFNGPQVKTNINITSSLFNNNSAAPAPSQVNNVMLTLNPSMLFNNSGQSLFQRAQDEQEIKPEVKKAPLFGDFGAQQLTESQQKEDKPKSPSKPQSLFASNVQKQLSQPANINQSIEKNDLPSQHQSIFPKYQIPAINSLSRFSEPPKLKEGNEVKKSETILAPQIIQLGTFGALPSILTISPQPNIFGGVAATPGLFGTSFGVGNTSDKNPLFQTQTSKNIFSQPSQLFSQPPKIQEKSKTVDIFGNQLSSGANESLFMPKKQIATVLPQQVESQKKVVQTKIEKTPDTKNDSSSVFKSPGFAQFRTEGGSIFGNLGTNNIFNKPANDIFGKNPTPEPPSNIFATALSQKPTYTFGQSTVAEPQEEQGGSEGDDGPLEAEEEVVDPTKSTGTYVYQVLTKTVASCDALYMRKNANQDLYNHVHINVEQTIKSGSLNIIAKMPRTNVVIYQGTLIPGQTKVQYINNNQENVKISGSISLQNDKPKVDILKIKFQQASIGKQIHDALVQVLKK